MTSAETKLNIQRKDLLAVRSGIIAHQCNLSRVAGGLAGAIFRAYPQAGKAYFDLLEEKRNSEEGVNSLFGKVQFVQVTPTLWVANLFGQVYPGQADPLESLDTPKGRLQAFAQALEELGRKSAEMGSPIYMPYNIGCNLGGGDWNQYSALIAKFLPDAVICQR